MTKHTGESLGNEFGNDRQILLSDAGALFPPGLKHWKGNTAVLILDIRVHANPVRVQVKRLFSRKLYVPACFFEERSNLSRSHSLIVELGT